MGLGIYTGATIKSKGLLRRRPSNKEVLGEIRDEIHRLLGHPLLAELARYTEDGSSLYAFLHPAEEPVEFHIDENNLLRVSAKTSSAGPGYHGFLVDLLEGLRERCGFSWDWENEEKEFQDETGYALRRDFTALQIDMANQARGIAQVVTERDGAHWTLSLPIDFHVAGDYFAISPMGYWDRSWFMSVAQAESEDILLTNTAEYFPWWNKDQDARFWMNLGLVLLWLNVRWRPPKDESERNEYRAALKCFELATKLDPLLRMPEEIAELRLLANGNGLDDFRPSSEGLGFRRRPMRQPITGAWSVILPGYYYSDTEDDGKTAVYWYNSRTFRGSSISFENGKSEPIDGQEATEGSPKLRFSIDHLRGMAKIEKLQEGANVYWQLTGKVSTTGNMCIVTICYADPADEDWAVETWKSVFMPSGKE